MSKLDHLPAGGADKSWEATEQDKARASVRQWPLPLAEDSDTVLEAIVWFGNEGDDIDPRFERNETL